MRDHLELIKLLRDRVLRGVQDMLAAISLG